MSGGGGGSGWREPERPTPGNLGLPSGDACDLTDRSPLASPNPPVIRSLSVGHVLSVVLVQGPPTVVQVHDVWGQVAGSITSNVLAQLTECLQKGFQYEAEVISIHGGTCIVEVRRK